MKDWMPNSQKTPWANVSPEEQHRRVAWSVATSCAIETGEDPVDIYNRMLALDESNESI